MLDLRQVRSFVAVAHQGSFTKAAQRLHYAQSSVTSQVRQLEEALGAPLLNRLPGGVELTNAGHSFLPHAERLLTAVEAAAHAVDTDAEPAGRLTLSASESVLAYRLPELLRRFQREYPQVELSLQAAHLCGEGPPIGPGIDIAISINEPIHDSALAVQALRAERICVVVAKDHPLALQGGNITADAIAREQLLLTEESCSYRSVFERALAHAGSRATRTLEFASVEAIRQCARTRLGVAVLPEMVIVDDLRRGTLVRLPWPAHGQRLRVYTQLVRRRDSWCSPAMQAFWQMATVMLKKNTAQKR